MMQRSRVQYNKRSEEGSQNEGQLAIQHCSSCGKTGHNMRTCQEDVEISNSLDSV